MYILSALRVFLSNDLFIIIYLIWFFLFKDLHICNILFDFIRLKEQLIRDLVKTGKDADLMNKKYAEKIKALEKVCTCTIFILEF